MEPRVEGGSLGPEWGQKAHSPEPSAEQGEGGGWGLEDAHYQSHRGRPRSWEAWGGGWDRSAQQR